MQVISSDTPVVISSPEHGTVLQDRHRALSVTMHCCSGRKNVESRTCQRHSSAFLLLSFLSFPRQPGPAEVPVVGGLTVDGASQVEASR
jgi:hypothetical protein